MSNIYIEHVIDLFDLLWAGEQFLFCYFTVKEWYDYQLTWKEDDYDGVSIIRVPSDKVWLPDIVLFNK